MNNVERTEVVTQPTDEIKYRENGSVESVTASSGCVAYYSVFNQLERIVWPNGATGHYDLNGREIKLEWPQRFGERMD